MLHVCINNVNGTKHNQEKKPPLCENSTWKCYWFPCVSSGGRETGVDSLNEPVTISQKGSTKIKPCFRYYSVTFALCFLLFFYSYRSSKMFLGGSTKPWALPGGEERSTVSVTGDSVAPKLVPEPPRPPRRDLSGLVGGLRGPPDLGLTMSLCLKRVVPPASEAPLTGLGASGSSSLSSSLKRAANSRRRLAESWKGRKGRGVEIRELNSRLI